MEYRQDAKLVLAPTVFSSIPTTRLLPVYKNGFVNVIVNQPAAGGEEMVPEKTDVKFEVEIHELLNANVLKVVLPK